MGTYGSLGIPTGFCCCSCCWPPTALPPLLLLAALVSVLLAGTLLGSAASDGVCGLWILILRVTVLKRDFTVSKSLMPSKPYKTTQQIL